MTLPSFLDDARVAIARDDARYASTPPFDPSEPFPEWPGAAIGREDNPAYRAVRETLRLLGFDAAHFGTAMWNPLGDLVTPGDHVVLKPNLVCEKNLGARAYGLTDTDSLVTHGSVIRAVADYAARALQGRGRLTIGDCPLQDTDWDAVVALVGLESIVASLRTRFPGISVELRDYRRGKAVIKGGVMVKRTYDAEGAAEGVEVDLGRHSMLMPIVGTGEFGVSRYPRRRMRRAHQGETNLYLVARDFLTCDVMINLPKMKSHMKAGVTCALKNFVGINSHKDYLPHFRYGSPKNGGDEYPDGNWFWDLMWAARHRDWDLDGGWQKLFWFGLGAVGKELLPVLAGRPRMSVAMGGGGWYGNDTLWRTVLDINRVYFYVNRQTTRIEAAPNGRRYLAILDGLIGGHRESPLAPTPIPSGMMMASQNPAAMDAVAITCMQYDLQRMPQVREAFQLPSLPLTAYPARAVRALLSDGRSLPLETLADEPWTMPFEASMGFKGHVERQPPGDRPAVSSDT